jgi:SAM-dependent methyltransferase
MTHTLDLSLLRSPVTGATLEQRDGSLWDADRSYPIIDGVPVLLDDGQSVFTVAKPAGPSGRTLRRRLLALIPEKNPGLGAEDRYRRFVDHIGSGTESARALVIGGGILGKGAEVLINAPNVEVVETDVYIGPRTQIVCDGHNLPFADGTFDGVVIQAVLEHVLDPVRVVSEIHRVLKPDGVVFAQSPFMVPVHEGPYDFTRWTETGHRRLFRMFTTIETGVTAGPGISLLWALMYFARAFPRRRSMQGVAAQLTILLCAPWLKRIDRILINRPGATDGACGVYFLGTRADHPTDDAEVIAAYRGALRAPSRE